MHWIKERHNANEVFGDCDTFALAARGGNLEVMKWLHKNECPWSADALLAASAAQNVAAMAWLINNGCPRQ